MGWTRRSFLSGAASAVAALSFPLRAAAAEWARYGSATIIDGLGFPGGWNTGPAGDSLTAGQLRDVADSGLSCTHLTLGEVGSMQPDAAYAAIMDSVAFWEREIAAHPDVLSPVRSAADIESSRAAGRTGLIFGLQDGVAFETDPDRLAVLQHFGIRVVQPTYNRRNLLGDGCMEPADAGLSRTGSACVEQIGELGMLLDLSHCGRRTTADALALATRPPAFTHTGCAAVTAHPRHRTDEEIRRVADLGGVTGIYVMPYLSGGRQPTAVDVIRHLEHALDVAGEDHVAVGTDGGISPTELNPEFVAGFRKNIEDRRAAGIAAPGETETGYLFASDLNTPRRFETLGGMLLDRGHSETRVAKILGGNLQRVFAEAWA
jgi:membrane dipeptidase